MKRIWVDAAKCLGCKTCELQCAIERNSLSRCLRQAVNETPLPAPRVRVHGKNATPFPLQCRHCEEATCITACPSGAMQRHEGGLVFIDEHRCRGCWMCVMACPFGVVAPSPEYHVAVKCDACLHMEEPACVASCPTGALMHADEMAYHRILAEKRGAIALWAAHHAAAAVVSIDHLAAAGDEHIVPEEHQS